MGSITADKMAQTRRKAREERKMKSTKEAKNSVTEEAKIGDVVCGCDSTCGEGGCQNPKEVREARMVDVEVMCQEIIGAAARAAYAAMGVYKESIGEPIPVWNDAPDHARQNAVDGVVAIIANPKVTAAQRHTMWVAYMRSVGWVLGPSNTGAKTSPLLVPYEELPESRHVCDRMFNAVVHAVLGERPDTALGGSVMVPLGALALVGFVGLCLGYLVGYGQSVEVLPANEIDNAVWAVIRTEYCFDQLEEIELLGVFDNRRSAKRCKKAAEKEIPKQQVTKVVEVDILESVLEG
jgi:hypothetical protein